MRALDAAVNGAKGTFLVSFPVVYVHIQLVPRKRQSL